LDDEMDLYDSKDEDQGRREGAGAQAVAAWRPPAPDIEKYRHHFADCDLSEEETDELIRALWKILAAFVDLGFGTAPVQSVLPATLTRPQEVNGKNNAGRLQAHFDQYTNNMTHETEEKDEGS
jgi:hypothetical protein